MGYRSYSLSRSSDADSKTVFKVWAGSVALAIGAHVWFVKCNMWLTLLKVVWMGVPIWALMIAAWIYGFLWYKSHENFTTGELIFYTIMVPVFAYPGAALGYYWCTDLKDTEIWCGQAIKVEYVERYYTEDSDGDKTWHGPYYYLHTQNGWKDQQDIAEGVYDTYVNRWGKSRTTSKVNSKADGLAYIYENTWDEKTNTIRYTATEHRWANVFKASDSILKVHGALQGYTKYMVEYPKVFDEGYGPIELNRVVQSGLSLDARFVNEANQVLKERLATIGPTRECNVILYITSAPIGAFHALKEFWCSGHNNDVIVVIGCPDGKTIEWVELMAWIDDGHGIFKENLVAKVAKLKTLNSGRVLANTICDQITASGSDGYKRLPLEKLDHLLSDIKLPWWGFVLIMIVNAIWLSPTVWLCIHD